MNDHSEHTPKPQGDQFDLSQLRAEFSKLSDTDAEMIKSQAQSVAGAMREGVSAAGSTIADATKHMGNSATQMNSNAQRAIISTEEDLEAAIGRNPLTAVACAVGVGMLIALLSARN